MKHQALLPFAMYAASVFACDIHYVRPVKRTPSGGELALLAQNPEAQQQASQAMQAHCPQGYDVLEEGETVVGQQTTTRAQEQTQAGRTWTGRPAAQTTTHSTTSTHDQTEWRIRYQCKASAAPAVAPASTAAPPSSGPQARATTRVGEVHELRILLH